MVGIAVCSQQCTFRSQRYTVLTLDVSGYPDHHALMRSAIVRWRDVVTFRHRHNVKAVAPRAMAERCQANHR